MSIQTISQDILNKAHDESISINDELNVEMSKMQKEFEIEFLEYRNNLISKFQREYELESKKIHGKYSRESKRIILSAKSKIISKVYSGTEEEIDSLDKHTREKILIKLIKRAKNLIGYDVVYASDEDLEFVKSKVEDAKVKSQKGLCGLVFETKNGSERLDLSFNALLSEVFEEYRDGLFKILFRE